MPARLCHPSPCGLWVGHIPCVWLSYNTGLQETTGGATEELLRYLATILATKNSHALLPLQGPESAKPPNRLPNEPRPFRLQPPEQREHLHPYDLFLLLCHFVTVTFFLLVLPFFVPILPPAGYFGPTNPQADIGIKGRSYSTPQSTPIR